MAVFVLDKHQQPLMPASEKRLNYPPPGGERFNCVKWHLMKTLLPGVTAWELAQ